MCLWERFSVCAPIPNPHPSPATSSSKNNYSAWAWHYQKPKGNILEVLDVANEFTWRPYLQTKNGYGNPDSYYDVPNQLHPWKLSK